MEVSKKITGSLVSFAMFLGMAAPLAPVLAESHPVPAPTHQGFCENIEKHASTIGQKVTDLDAKLDARHSDHRAKLDAKREEFNNKIISRRDTHDAKHEEVFVKLRSLAQTDEQKAAVEKFVSSIQSAVDTRQIAINEALSAHKSGIDAEFDLRWSEVDAAHAALDLATKAAFNKARADCAGGVDSRTVRATLHADLKAAREAYHNAVKRTGAHHDVAKKHHEELKTTVKQAVEDYKATVAAAREELKAVFGQE